MLLPFTLNSYTTLITPNSYTTDMHEKQIYHFLKPFINSLLHCTNFLLTSVNFCQFLLTSFYFSSIKNDSFFSFSSSEMYQLHLLVGSHATGTDFLLCFFFYMPYFCLKLLYQVISLESESISPNIRVYITKDYVIIRKYNIIKFVNYLTHNVCT